jgi:hypothetical protein
MRTSSDSTDRGTARSREEIDELHPSIRRRSGCICRPRDRATAHHALTILGRRSQQVAKDNGAKRVC